MSEFYKKVVSFAKEHIAPESKKNDDTASFSVESFKAMGKAG